MADQTSPAQPDNSGDIILPKMPIRIVLNNTIRCPQPVLPNAVCEFTVDWNFATNSGTAKLETLDGVNVAILLHPLGIWKQLDFMSDMPPTPYHIAGKEVIISRVILDIKQDSLPPESIVSAAIMFNRDGSCIEMSTNFDEVLLNTNNS